MNGIWPGIKGRTGEHIIGTEKGVVKAYTVKRRPEEERWSLEELNGMRGTPGKPTPGSSDIRIPVRVRVPEIPIAKEERTTIPRGVRTEKKDFERHGYTEGCEGCVRMQMGGERRSHTQQCRDRMLKAMSEDDEGREKIKRKEEEINEKLARDLEKRMRNEEAKAKAENDRGETKGGRVPTMVGRPHQ